MTTQEILAQVAAGKIKPEEAGKMITALTQKVDVTKPRLQKDGKLCVMSGTTLTAYQLVRIRQVADDLLGIVKAELAKPAREEKCEAKRAGKDGKKDEFVKLFVGDVLMAYKPEHVEHVKQYFASAKS